MKINISKVNNSAVLFLRIRAIFEYYLFTIENMTYATKKSQQWKMGKNKRRPNHLPPPYSG